MNGRWIVFALLPIWYPALARGGDAVDGRALYESRCGACHERSVHSRAARKSQELGELRRWVSRWNAELGGAWKDEEIDAVTRHLNQRYYQFPCPAPFCQDNKG